jgi:hypothetical protein
MTGKDSQRPDAADRDPGGTAGAGPAPRPAQLIAVFGLPGLPPGPGRRQGSCFWRWPVRGSWRRRQGSRVLRAHGQRPRRTRSSKGAAGRRRPEGTLVDNSASALAPPAGSPRRPGTGALLALANGVMAGVGGVYASTHSAAITVLAAATTIVLAAMALISSDSPGCRRKILCRAGSRPGRLPDSTSMTRLTHPQSHRRDGNAR